MSQGTTSSPPPGEVYIYQKLTLSEAWDLYLQFVFLAAATFLPGFAEEVSGWGPDILSVTFPSLVGGIPSLVTTFSLFAGNRIGFTDLVFALVGFAVSLVLAALSWASRCINFFAWLANVIGFGLEEASGIGFAIALFAFFIGILFLLGELLYDCNT